MTYSYTKQVSNVRLLGLARLLFIWRASIYKLVFREILIYCVLYGGLSVLYRLMLSPNERKLFEQVVVFCSTLEGTLPLTFILGFYVTFVANRWWEQFSNVSWPDRIIAYISTLVEGDSRRAVMIRRTLMRYLFLSQCILMSGVSKSVRQRFPEMKSFVKFGIMTEAELKAITDDRVPDISSKYWVPTQWFASLLVCARKEKFIKDSYSFNTLLNELSKYKQSLGKIIIYDMVNVPLSNTQVATISVYLFFLTTLLSRQFIEWSSVQEQYKEFASSQYKIDMYFPIFTILQLFFYVGWLKVAEQMLNPFGEDDDDFECNWILDRNFKVGFSAVDFHSNNHPPLEEDEFIDCRDPDLSYTVASERYRLPNGWHGSMYNLTVTNQSYEMVRPRSSFSNSSHNQDDSDSQQNIPKAESNTKVKHRFSNMINKKLFKKNRNQLPLFMREVISSGNTPDQSELNSPNDSKRFDFGSAPSGLFNVRSVGSSRPNPSDYTALRDDIIVECENGVDSASNSASEELIETSNTNSQEHDSENSEKKICLDPPKKIVANWMSDQKNGFCNEELLSSQYLSSSACQLSTNDNIVGSTMNTMCNKDEPHDALSILEKHNLNATTSAGNLNEMDVNLEIQNNFIDEDADQSPLKRVAFEPVM